MPNWDIFHSDRLEVERNLSPSAVKAAAARGEILGEDLARPAGSGEAWTRISEHAELAALIAGAASAEPAGPTGLRAMFDDDEDDGDDFGEEMDRAEAMPRKPLRPGGPKFPGTPPLPSGVSKGTTEDLDPVGFPDAYDRDLDLSLRSPRTTVDLDDADEYDPEAEDEEAAEFTFSRGGAETVEELDLAAMVDVAFQLVLFFLVTASTVVFKTLEVPRPKAEQAKGAATQAAGRTMEDLQKDFILVEIDPTGGVKIDHENGPNDFNGLANRLRQLRQDSGRTSMLLTADSLTAHKNAVMAYDAANEVSLKIAIAQPKPNPGAPPVPPVAPKGP